MYTQYQGHRRLTLVVVKSLIKKVVWFVLWLLLIGSTLRVYISISVFKITFVLTGCPSNHFWGGRPNSLVKVWKLLFLILKEVVESKHNYSNQNYPPILPWSRHLWLDLKTLCDYITTLINHTVIVKLGPPPDCRWLAGSCQVLLFNSEGETVETLWEIPQLFNL